MTNVILTQSSMFIIGPVAVVLGKIMDGIFIFLDSLFHIENIGLCIILFTLIIYLCLLPLTIKQQKFSKLSAQMNPELQAIQKKYRNKKDQDSMMKMNAETKEVYEKYGTSPTGSCLQLVIQMPILLALYQVIYRIPAYVTSVKECFTPLVDKILGVANYQDTLTQFKTDIAMNTVNLDFSSADTTRNTMVDMFNKLSSANWATLQDKFPTLTDTIQSTQSSFDQMNYFLGLNISNTPMFIMQNAFADGNYLLVAGALLIPILAAATQLLNTKLMPQQAQAAGNDQANAMMNSMKTMTYVMPIVSAVFTFTLPSGMGIYWIAGAVVRSVQQLVINKHLNKMDLNVLVEKNKEKAKAKRERKGAEPKYTSGLSQAAKINTKNIEEPKAKASDLPSQTAKGSGSISSRANLVKSYNEKNNKSK